LAIGGFQGRSLSQVSCRRYGLSFRYWSGVRFRATWPQCLAWSAVTSLIPTGERRVKLLDRSTWAARRSRLGILLPVADSTV